MNPTEYVNAAVRTKPGEYEVTQGIQRMIKRDIHELNHAAMGLLTECGEFMDALKKYVHYGKSMDLVNLEEEIGDIMWYMAALCSELELDMEEVAQANIDKLFSRKERGVLKGDGDNR